MKRLQGAFAGAVLALLLAGGCRSSLEGKKVSTLPSPDEQSGLTYYLIEPVFTIDLKDRHDGKPAEPVYDVKVGFAADEDKKFSVRLKNGTISNDVLSLKLRPDGTLASFGSKSESRLPELISSLGSLVVSGLGFSAFGVGGLAFLDEDNQLEAALRTKVCAGAITPQQYSTTLCVAQRLVDGNPVCNISPKSPCKATVPDIPPPAVGAAELKPEALQVAQETMGILILEGERELWTKLSQPPGLLEDELEGEIVTANEVLRTLRDFEALVAHRRGADPLREDFTGPDPVRHDVARIGSRLEKMIDGLFKRFSENLAKEELASELAKRMTNLTEIAAAAFPGSSLPGNLDLSKLLAQLITLQERRITSRFQRGELAAKDTAKDAEKFSLLDYALIRRLEAIRAKILEGSPLQAAARITRDLIRKRARAEDLYARYVAGAIDKATFEKGLEDYAFAIVRLLEYDDRLRRSDLSIRRDRLSDFIGRELPLSPPLIDKNSSAYRSYREELDRVVGEIGARIGTFIDPKKPTDPLPRGTQVSRTLNLVVSCVVDGPGRIFDNKGRLLDLAEIWMRYGGKEAVVFRNRHRSSDPLPSARLDCGGSLFGSSMELPRTEKVESSTLARPQRPRSGMHVRRLTTANLMPDNAAIEGVLVQVPAPYDVVTVLLDGSRNRMLKTTTLNLPADDEFLDVGFKGGLYRSQELTMAFHDNGALAEFKLDSTEELSESAKSLADATKAVTDSLVAIEEANKEPAAPDPLAVQNDQLLLQTINMMLAANLQAIQEGRTPLPYPDVFGLLLEN